MPLALENDLTVNMAAERRQGVSYACAAQNRSLVTQVLRVLREQASTLYLRKRREYVAYLGAMDAFNPGSRGSGDLDTSAPYASLATQKN